MNGKLRYFSMFTGVGGFEIGLQGIRKTMDEGRNARTKFEPIGFSEIDKYASQLLANKYPNIRNYGDATKINASELPDFDMLCGGFPCQSFSIAGKRRGFQDTRGTMFFEIARILEAKRPSVVFLENVKGLLNHEEGKTFTIIIQTLEKLGYDVQWMVLNSKFFGVPQNRERVFIIGNLRGTSRPEILPFRQNFPEAIELSEQQATTNTLTRNYDKGQAVGTYITERQQLSQGSQGYRVYGTEGTSVTLAGQAGGIGAKTGLYAIPVLTPDRINKRQNGRRFKEDGEESFTLTKTDIHGVMIQSHSPRSGDSTKGGTGPLVSEEHSFTIDRTPHNDIMGMKIRRLTPKECERLQGFPDGYTEGFSDTQRYKMMGNAVTTKVIKAIAEKLI